MKTITFGTDQSNFGTVLLFFICFLSSFNSQSQKIQTSLTEIWKNGTWENFTQTLNTYDGNGYLTHDLNQEWNVSWKNRLQTNYTNNPDGTVQQSISQSWNTGTSQWNNLQRVTYTYNAAKKVLTSESEFWDDSVNIFGEWTFFLKNTNTYDGNNYLIKNLMTDGAGVIYQTTYTNNLDGTISRAVMEMGNVWDGLEIYERITYTYNNSKLTMVLYEDYKFISDIWENYYMDAYEYDDSGYLTYTLYKEWMGGSWINSGQSYITNYGNGNPFQIVLQVWDDIGLVWTNNSRTTLTYTTLGVDEHAFEKSFTVYPNPVQDRITIKTDGNNNIGVKYWVTDQLGRQFLDGSITDMETVIDVSQLASGVYFIKMGQNKNQSIKIIKK